LSFLDENVVLVIGLVLILASVPIVVLYDRNRLADHFARSFVALGVAMLAAFVAVTVFDLNAQRMENDRNLLQQQTKQSKRLGLISNLRFFALEYGFVAYQIQATRSDCGNAGAAGTVSEACRESASYAANVGRLIPQDYAVITALSDASNAFAKSIRIPTILTDAEVTIKARMPVAIENFLATALNSNPAAAGATREHFLKSLSEFESVAEDASTAFCVFAAALTEGEAKLEQTISALDGVLVKGQEPIADVIRNSAKNANMGDFACSNPRAQIERNLPTAGGGR